MKFYKKLIFRQLALVAFLSSFASNVIAFGIPVVDPGTIAQGVLNNIKLVIEQAFVKETMNLAGTMNSTIGASAQTFFQYYANTFKPYSNKAGPGTDNGFFVFPNELGDYCSITTQDIKKISDKDAMVNCMKKLITLRNSENMSDQRTARDIYVRSFHEAAYANVAEAIVQRSFAANYEKEVLEPLARKVMKAKTVRDDYSGVIMVNKEMASLLNRILLVYSAKTSYDALRDYGDFEIYPQDVLELH